MMPRQARMLSSTNVYHVILRANERRNSSMMMKTGSASCRFSKKKDNGGWFLYAYCLMRNHVHLLVNSGGSELSRLIKQTNTSYAFYFNKKHQRVGHVFQDRYRSEAVEDERYLLALVRYIHNNQIKAGVVKVPSEYPWSSYRDYVNYHNAKTGLVDTDFILGHFSNEPSRAVRLFTEFSLVVDDKACIDVEEETDRNIKTEKEATAFIRDYLQAKGLSLAPEAIAMDKMLRREISFTESYVMDTTRVNFVTREGSGVTSCECRYTCIGRRKRDIEASPVTDEDYTKIFLDGVIRVVYD